jgi:nitrite reductase/ring-hydroxylating ferredoxin subunit
MEFTSIAKKSELPESGMKSFNISGKDILIIRQGGKYYAIDRYCSHMGGDLLKGSVEKNIITCPRHGSRFDITNGKSISGPNLVIFKLKTKPIRVYELKIEGEQILVRIDNN